MKLTVRGKAAGVDAAGFAELAKTAEGRCPVSNALRGNVEITLEAALD
jgi:osmotically inducible protein OsmC